MQAHKFTSVSIRLLLSAFACAVVTTAQVPSDTTERADKPPISDRTEIVVFDWNQVITDVKQRSIEGPTKWRPNLPPVRNNFDWTLPPNFADGTYYVRIELRKMAIHDTFKFLFNHWQLHPGPKMAETQFEAKELSFDYRGDPIVKTFSVRVRDFKENYDWDPVHYAKFDWQKPRTYVGFFFPDFPNSQPASKLDPKTAPVDLRFTIVNVAPGHAFSGWQNYVK